MKILVAMGLVVTALLSQTVQAVEAALPKRDLTVELRQIEEGNEGGSHYSAGGADAAAWEPQMVQVRNGEKAQLRMQDAIPMQWTQSVSTATLPSGNTNASSSNSNGSANALSINNALTWFDAGQSITVQPKWPGGNKPATVEIEVQRTSVGQRMGADLPTQTRNSMSTTVTLPLAEWFTIAATGRAPKPGTYSSESGLQVRRLLQVRVMAP